MISRIILLSLLLLCIAFNFGCDRTVSERVDASPLGLVDAATDPRLANAIALVEKSPESPTGYTGLAAIFIKKARETGDFGLNSKAEMAVDKALEIAPDDIDARKLKASLQLTFHRFAEGLALAKKLQVEFPSDAFVYGLLTDANVELGNYADAVAQTGAPPDQMSEVH